MTERVAPLTLEDRFWRRVIKTDGCWFWIGSLDRTGYGVSNRGVAGSRRAHRTAYLLLVGPIPAKLVLDHLCRVTFCVRPDHLEAVTDRTNVLRGEGIAARSARMLVCEKGHPFDYHNGTQRICRKCRYEKKKRFRRLHYVKNPRVTPGDLASLTGTAA